jgi:hypothetical protein
VITVIRVIGAIRVIRVKSGHGYWKIRIVRLVSIKKNMAVSCVDDWLHG